MPFLIISPPPASQPTPTSQHGVVRVLPAVVRQESRVIAGPPVEELCRLLPKQEGAVLEAGVIAVIVVRGAVVIAGGRAGKEQYDKEMNPHFVFPVVALEVGVRGEVLGSGIEKLEGLGPASLALGKTKSN